MGLLLRRKLKKAQGKPTGRNWKVDPRPGDSVSVFSEAYFRRPPRDDMNPTPFRTVVRVTKSRVFYRIRDNGPIRSCSRATWRKLDSDLSGRAMGEAVPFPKPNHEPVHQPPVI